MNVRLSGHSTYWNQHCHERISSSLMEAISANSPTGQNGSVIPNQHSQRFHGGSQTHREWRKTQARWHAHPHGDGARWHCSPASSHAVDALPPVWATQNRVVHFGRWPLEWCSRVLWRPELKREGWHVPCGDELPSGRSYAAGHEVNTNESTTYTTEGVLEQKQCRQALCSSGD